ncbi:membrane-associated protein, putative [Bodo saltans]|uniref:Membrane-associated protein, putative n=1 Tax=Bodo saltans TaxID=75058 RepID=A0A0S4IL41_BODSA|nr:membrane-associated protein, putative [Bodo saltans]|eukprot:CUE70298.1 membrane-associated protein, putative [Bodo saltans]
MRSIRIPSSSMHVTMASVFISALYLIALFAWTGTASSSSSSLSKFCWSIDQQHFPPPCEPSLAHLVDTTFGSISIRPPSRLKRRGEILVTSYQNQTLRYEPNCTVVVANEPNGFVVAYPLDLFLNQSFPNNSIEIQAAATPIVLGHDLDVCTLVPWGRSQPFPVEYDAHPTTATFLRSGDIAFADSVPHSNILRVNRTLSSKGSVNLAAGLDDSELCNFNVTNAQNNTNAKMNSWGWTYGIIEDPREDGCLYVSHYYVVGRLSPDGNYSYYFGDYEKPGTWNDTFNSVTLPRWSATTNNPTQLAIDSTTRKMYVAESGMHTIREIDMQSGLATIVAGNLSWSDFPPINCSYPSNCTADQLQLIYPSSVAVYVSAAFGETWLFVGDFTAALIYRIVLTGNIRTNAVTIISGKLFQYWDKSSTPARHSIAAYFDTTTNTGALFIVGQKGIQRIDWAEPPLQPLPSPTPTPTSTVDETAAGATAATVIVTALMGGVAVTESTTLLTVGSVRCRSSSSRKRSIMQQIFYFLASNGDENTPSTGAAWGMFAIVIIFSGLWGMFVIVIIFSGLHVGAAALVYYRLDEEEKAKRGAWSTVCASGRCPSFSWITADTLFPLSLYSAMEAVTTASQTSGEIVSGFILLALITATFIVTRVYLTKHITPALQFVVSHLLGDLRRRSPKPRHLALPLW